MPPSSPSGFSSKNHEFQYLNKFFRIASINYYVKKVLSSDFPPVFDLESRYFFENGTVNPLSDSESSASSPTEGVSAVKLFELMLLLVEPEAEDSSMYVRTRIYT